ncbi:hypothetical protein [Salipiger aestuarii]|uniref:hypothetical protein n=1 Tax=Salipiger aestuarii TaxID=568098 RepID=UPI001238B4DE|nr:hypothetical protein [Salipiger aestuarii]KAA8616265.1 hypothetical protein AL037_01555 [Salipiger aestuarii]
MKRTSFTKLMHRRHLSVTRALGYVLTLGTVEGWSDFCAIIAAHLSDHERAAIAFWALRSLDPEHADIVMREAFDLMDDPGFPSDLRRAA